eukprot:6174811-Pleurochrysis_carterae.AAC.2
MSSTSRSGGPAVATQRFESQQNEARVRLNATRACDGRGCFQGLCISRRRGGTDATRNLAHATTRMHAQARVGQAARRLQTMSRQPAHAFVSLWRQGADANKCAHARIELDMHSTKP